MPPVAQKKKAHPHSSALKNFKKADPILARRILKTGLTTLTPKRAPNLFTPLLSSIIYQQLAGSAAKAIHGRVVALFENREVLDPAEFLKLPEKKLREAGLS